MAGITGTSRLTAIYWWRESTAVEEWSRCLSANFQFAWTVEPPDPNSLTLSTDRHTVRCWNRPSATSAMFPIKCSNYRRISFIHTCPGLSAPIKLLDCCDWHKLIMMVCKSFCLCAEYDIYLLCDYKTENGSISVQTEWLSRNPIMIHLAELHKWLLVCA
jgi:hypothetical protein